ncbi:MAG TPA: FadR family transcriptional regulator [Candidatus Fimimorpha excrementavium]|nr:FadR family transcriptional regulator [Candidatus Fimimorpha excrementavium]
MTNLSDEEKSLPERLAEDVIAFILQEHLEPGDKLPNESVLSEKMGAGRSSIREAMKLLASRNIVTIRQGSGTYIAKTPGIVEDPLGFTFIGDKEKLVTDLLEVRFLLEPSIAGMAASNATAEDILRIRRLCLEVEELLAAGTDHTHKDIEFHTAIAMSSKNLVVPRLIPIINSTIPLFIEMTGNILKQETMETHRAVTEAITAHDPIRAHDAMYLHLVYNRSKITSKFVERSNTTMQAYEASNCKHPDI